MSTVVYGGVVWCSVVECISEVVESSSWMLETERARERERESEDE